MDLSFALISKSPGAQTSYILIVPVTLKRSGMLKIPSTTLLAAEDCFVADRKGRVQQGIPGNGWKPYFLMMELRRNSVDTSIN